MREKKQTPSENKNKRRLYGHNLRKGTKTSRRIENPLLVLCRLLTIINNAAGYQSSLGPVSDRTMQGMSRMRYKGKKRSSANKRKEKKNRETVVQDA